MSNYEMCDNNRFEIIKELKEYIIEATNIETSPKEMEVLDDICFRLWQLDLTLENKRKLEKENQDLKLFVESYSNARDELLIKNQKLENAIEILKDKFDFKFNDENKVIYLFIKELSLHIYSWCFKSQQEYELLKEVLE